MGILFSIISGFFASIMLLLNSILSNNSSGFMASFVNHLSAFIFLLIPIYLCPTINFRKKLSTNKKLPYYYYFGGVFGSIAIVLSSISSGSEIFGLTNTVGIMICSQLITSLIIDYFFHRNIKFNVFSLMEILFISMGSTLIIAGNFL